MHLCAQVKVENKAIDVSLTKKPKNKTKKKVIDALGSWEIEVLSYGLGVRKDLQ
jgi:hypothetical protein